MKLLDVNLLLYAVNEDAPRHASARRWLESTISGTETVALAWPVLVAFLRISTQPALFPRPLGPDEAFDTVRGWLEAASVVVVHPTARHFDVLRGLLEPLGAAGNLTSDAHLAAIAIEHGAELYSSDLDFGRFQGLRWVNPLA